MHPNYKNSTATSHITRTFKQAILFGKPEQEYVNEYQSPKQGDVPTASRQGRF